MENTDISAKSPGKNSEQKKTWHKIFLIALTVVIVGATVWNLFHLQEYTFPFSDGSHHWSQSIPLAANLILVVALIGLLTRYYKNKLRSAVMTLLGLSLLIYLVRRIGVDNILANITEIDATTLGLALTLTLLATILRISKLVVMLRPMSLASVVDIYTFSKIGANFSFIGYFSPLLVKKYRKTNYFRALFCDRYLEVLTTVSIAFAAIFFLPENDLKLPLVGIFGGLLLTLLAAAYLDISRFNFFGIGLLDKLKHSFNIHLITKDKKQLALLICLSVAASCIDFYLIKLVFQSLGEDANFYYVPVIWAAAGLVSFITSSQIGANEYSVVYLYKHLAGIPEATSLVMAILSRLYMIFPLFAIVALRPFYSLYLKSTVAEAS